MERIMKIKELTAELLNHCHLYYDLDSPTISDAEYDKKFDELFKLENEANFYLANSPTRKVQGEILPYLEKVHHSVPMLSADKSTNIDDVKKFIGNKNIVASFKLDGSTVVVKYNNGKLIQGLSRGSGIDGENITHTVKMIKNLPMTIPYKEYLEIRGEALIPWEYYNEMNIDGSLGHPRNVVSGALRQLDANEAAKRNIYFYAFTLVNWKEVLNSIYPSYYGKYKGVTLSFLKEQGFDVVPYGVFDYADALNNMEENILSHFDRATYELPTDGWCFEYDDLVYGESLGSTEHHDRRLYALKPELQEYTTIFRGVDYRTCRTGVVSLKALFDPVEIENTTVTKATLHNIDFFNNLKLGIGDEISVAKFNEIIPGVVENKTCSGTYELINKCPSCGAELIIKNTGTANVLYCSNEDCPSRHLSKFTHFVSKNCIDIRGLSEKTLEQLISAGFLHTYRDIYHLAEHKDKLTSLEGLGEKSVSTLLKSIEKSRDIKPENFIAALGIPDVGLSTAKAIATYCKNDIEKFISMTCGGRWHYIEGIGINTDHKINVFMKENFTEICDLAKEFNFIVPNKVEVKESLLNGIKFCITGSFSQSRDKLKEQLEARGARFVSSVSKNLDILFCGEKAGSKLTKAQSLGVKIIDENGLIKLLED